MSHDLDYFLIKAQPWILFYVCEYVHMCAGTRGGQASLWDPLALELKATGSCLLCAGNYTRVL